MPIAKVGEINIHYEVSGSGDPLLLIMGFAMPGAAWIPALPFLTGFQSIFFDNRGTGNSDHPSGPYSARAMADDAVGLLDFLGIRTADVYGISMGGMIAQELVLNHPERVSKLVLGCTSPGGPDALRPPAEVVAAFVEAISLLASNPEAAVDRLVPVLYPPEFLTYHPEVKTLMLLATAGIPPIQPDTAQRTLMGIAEFNAWDRLSEIKCPTLIIHGDQDRLIPIDNARLLRERIPHAEFWLIPGAGHNFMAMDLPGIVHRISQWLKS